MAILRVLLCYVCLLPAVATAQVTADHRLFIIDLRSMLHDDREGAADAAFDKMIATISHIKGDRDAGILVFRNRSEPKELYIEATSNEWEARIRSAIANEWHKYGDRLGNPRHGIELEYVQREARRWLEDRGLNKDSESLHLVWFGNNWQFGEKPNARIFPYGDECIRQQLLRARITPLRPRVFFEFRLLDQQTLPPGHAVRTLISYFAHQQFDRATFVGIYGAACQSRHASDWPKMPTAPESTVCDRPVEDTARLVPSCRIQDLPLANPATHNLGAGAGTSSQGAPSSGNGGSGQSTSTQIANTGNSGQGGGSQNQPSGNSGNLPVMQANTPSIQFPTIWTPGGPSTPSKGASHHNANATVSRFILHTPTPIKAAQAPGIQFKLHSGSRNFDAELVLQTASTELRLKEGNAATFADLGIPSGTSVEVSVETRPGVRCQPMASSPDLLSLEVLVTGTAQSSGEHMTILSGLHCNRDAPLRSKLLELLVQ